MTCGREGQWPRQLRSKRLCLRAITLDDLADESPEWLAVAEQEIMGRERSVDLLTQVREGTGTYWIDLRSPDGPCTVGALSARLIQGDLVWGWLAIAPAWRARGLAAAAAALVERAAVRAGAARARVRVSAANGVALYFWLRLGYRPLSAALASVVPGSDGDAHEGTWMLRELS